MTWTAAPPATRDRLLRRFVAAIEADDQAALLDVLAEDAAWTTDSGGKVPSIRNVLVGADRITRLLLGVHRKTDVPVTERLVPLNGEPVLLTYGPAGLYAATYFETDGKRIYAVYRVTNPEKLRQVAAATG